MGLPISALEDALGSYWEWGRRKLLFSAVRTIPGNMKQNLSGNSHFCFVLSRTRGKKCLPLSINALDMWMAPSAPFPHFRYVCILHCSHLQMGFIGTDSNSEYLNSQTGLLYLTVQRCHSLCFHTKTRTCDGGRKRGMWERCGKMRKKPPGKDKWKGRAFHTQACFGSWI